MSDLKNTPEQDIIKLIEDFERLKDIYKTKKAELHEKLATLGIGKYFQNPENNVVYKIKKPTGTFINFDEIGYDRTKKADEKKGTLSKKEAEAQGFTL